MPAWGSRGSWRPWSNAALTPLVSPVLSQQPFSPSAPPRSSASSAPLALLQQTEWDAAINPTIRALAGQIPLLHEILKEASTDGNVVEARPCWPAPIHLVPPQPALKLSAVVAAPATSIACARISKSTTSRSASCASSARAFPSQIDGGFASLAFFFAPRTADHDRLADPERGGVVLCHSRSIFAGVCRGAGQSSAARVSCTAGSSAKRFAGGPLSESQRVPLAILRENGPLPTAAEQAR